MNEKIHISASGNTTVPCVLLLEEMDYTVSNRFVGPEEYWSAWKDGIRLSALDPCTVLGLAKLIEARGKNWKAKDVQIDKFFQRFYSKSKRNNKATSNYDGLSDTLHISFEPGAKGTGIELNDHILLRIDKKRRKAVGLTFFEYSLLAQKTEMGSRSFPLSGLAGLSGEAREMILQILQSSPVNEYLKISAYTPSATEIIPITTLTHQETVPFKLW